MVVNNKCVYRHRRLDTYEVFYVGIGTPKRPYSSKDRSKFWKKIVNKGGYQIEILAENLSWEDACDLEKLLISEYGRKNLGTGTLCNMTDGGDGTLNVVVSKKTRKKLSNHSKNLERTNEWYNKVSKALTGRKLPELHKKKLSLAKKGKPSNQAKKVINIKTLEVYNSVTDLAKKINVKQTTLSAKLRGENKNDTIYVYLNNYKENECNK